MSQWIDICPQDDVVPGSGVCAQLGDAQVAVFRTGQDQFYAVGNHDPLGGANVLSRGLIAEVKGTLTVASPLYKHHYCLRTGQCLQDEQVQLPVYPVRVQDGLVQLAC
ncbi:nitrite reductase small subunit NirD [Ferrimonas pelagia]|uniref:Nitrite reductase small subunit NirD n=1 Tax=Ferrimonas pelagia TaxID=1177826 RepID=A0ABP9F438_9GAMM